MIQGRQRHGSVGLGNKLFVISHPTISSCEVFDSNSYVFTKIKGLDPSFYSYPRLPLVSIGYKIIVFAKKWKKPQTKVLFIYNFLKDQWSLEDNKLTSNI